jgi:hypothetical protein
MIESSHVQNYKALHDVTRDLTPVQVLTLGEKGLRIGRVGICSQKPSSVRGTGARLCLGSD